MSDYEQSITDEAARREQTMDEVMYQRHLDAKAREKATKKFRDAAAALKWQQLLNECPF